MYIVNFVNRHLTSVFLYVVQEVWQRMAVVPRLGTVKEIGNIHAVSGYNRGDTK